MSMGLVAAQAALIAGQADMSFGGVGVDSVYLTIPPPKIQPKPVCWVNSVDWSRTENLGNTTLAEFDATALLLLDTRDRMKSQETAYGFLDLMVNMTSRLPIRTRGLSRVLPFGGIPTVTTVGVNGRDYIAAQLTFRMTFTQRVDLLSATLPPVVSVDGFLLANAGFVATRDGYGVRRG